MQPMTRGKVPQFTMRPHPAIVGLLIMVLLIGTLLALSFFVKEEGTGVHRHHGVLTLIITAFISFCLLVLGTAKFWYRHLWKKNSTHDRHKQHTQYHPSMRDKAYRDKR